MSSAVQRLVASFDRSVPPELAEPLARQRGRLIVVFSMVGGLASAGFALGGRSLGADWMAVIAFGSIATLNAVVPILLRVTRSVWLSANVVAALWLAGVACGLYVRGGLDNPVAMAVAPLPLLATMLSGWRSGLVWTVLSIALLAAFALAPSLGIELVDHVIASKRLTYAISSAISMLLLVVTLAAGVLAVLDASGESLAIEVRHRQAAENKAKMLRAGRLAALGEVASSLAHEINNPLMYVMANLEFIADDARLPADAHEAVTDAHDGATRIASIVKDLKAYASSEDETIEQVDLGVVAQSTARLVRGYVRRRATLVLDLHPCPPVDGNWSQLGQVVINLVVNSCSAIDKGDPESNEIRISTGADDDGQPFLLVVDTGHGIPADELARVTEPFFSASKAAGTGLGLTVTQNIVDELGGSLTIESEVGVGTRVRVSLPAARDESARDKRLTLPASMGELNVLLVDEDPLIGAALGRMLAGHSLRVARTLDEATEQLATRPDLILLDTPGPNGGSLAWFAALLAERPGLAERVVLLSGGAGIEAPELRLTDLTDRIVLKPVGREDLRDLINRFAGPG